jgi:LysR family transcriptional regulator, glycine cleavage system transcriptional activator
LVPTVTLWSIISTVQALPLNALRAFAAVYAQGGVRAAARQLQVAHSAVSRHLAELDGWMGVPLTQQGAGRRRLAFTPQGEALARATIAAFREIETAAAALREARSINSVTITTPPSLASRWLLPRLPRLEEAHPQIEVSVLVDQRLVDMDAGEADLAIRMGRGHWPDGRSEPLMDDVLYPVMSPSYWEKSGRPHRPADLVGLRLLHDRDANASWESWRLTHGPEELDVQKGPRFASTDLVLRAAALGQGVALARHRLAMDEVSAGTLVRPIARLSVSLGPAYWIVLPKRSRVREATTAVVEWLKAQAG